MREVTRKDRIEWIDTAKGIGLLLVIIGHLSIPLLPTWIYTFHMPLFFILSGVVFSGDKYTFKDFLRKRLKSLVIPYFSLGLVIYLFYVIINSIIGETNGLYGTNREMFSQFLYQKHFWTIWFLACLFVVEILYFLIYSFWGNNFGLLTSVSLVIGIMGFLQYDYGCTGLPWNFDVALVAQFFFHLGYWFKCSNKLYRIAVEKKKYKDLGMLICLLGINVIAAALCIRLSEESLDMSVGLYGNKFLTMISALAGILFVVVLSKYIKNKVFTYMGQNTMIIFAWHSRIVIVFCNYIYELLGAFQDEGVVSKIMQAFVTFIIIFIIE